MEANELRIGNKLQKSNGNIYTVLRLDNTSDVLVQEERGLLTLGYNLYGIPITEEWLLKFGFTKSENKFGTWFNKGVYVLEFQSVYNSYFFLKMISKDEYLLLNNNIKYVHQLQNLYFALTGTELTIK